MPSELSRLKIQEKGHICEFPYVRKQAVIKAATELVNQHLVLLFWEHNTVKSSENEHYSPIIGPVGAGFFYDIFEKTTFRNIISIKQICIKWLYRTNSVSVKEQNFGKGDRHRHRHRHRHRQSVPKNFNCLISCKLKTTVLTRSVFIFSKSSS